jgi:hypothetical protein
MNPTEPTKKKDTVRISKKDLLKLLSENEQQAAQIKQLQERCNEYMEEVRSLKKDLEEAEEAMLKDEEGSIADRIKKAMEDVPRNPDPMPFHPMGPDIYIDGASRFGR